MMEPKCPSCGVCAGGMIHAMYLDVPIDAESVLQTFTVYCLRCGYTFAVLPRTDQILTAVKGHTQPLGSFEEQPLWSVVKFVPKPEWVK